MPIIKRHLILLLLPILLVLGCDPLAPQPTAQVIIVSPIPSATTPPTATTAVTNTPVPTSTPIITPSPTPFPCDEPKGRIEKFDDFRSTIAEERLRYRVYLPPCYFQTQKRYPVVFLLHAAKNIETQWEKLGVPTALDQGFQFAALPPMIVVMPYTGSIANDNSFPPDPSYESVMLDELLPTIDRDFCTWSSRKYRAIGGISRGGFWALTIALRHPDVFGILGGHSAFIPDDSTEVPPAFNPLDLAQNSALLPQADLRIYLDNGANDFAGTNQEQFSSRLTGRNIAHTYVVNPIGEHNDQYWAAHVTEYLAFYGRDWPKNAAELPSCLQPSP
jgi:enterochelin esterase-like enzyme